MSRGAAGWILLAFGAALLAAAFYAARPAWAAAFLGFLGATAIARAVKAMRTTKGSST